jgi:phosphoglucomutase
VAILTGRNLVAAEQKVNQLFLFVKTEKDGKITFELEKRIIVKKMPEFEKVCMEFHFVNKPGLDRDEMIFAR